MFSKKGFTLTEMLFVVVIAAGILALALPSYRKAKDRSQYQAATGMLMDLGNAVEAITNDLAMQGVNVSVTTGDSTYDSVVSSGPSIETQYKTLKEIYLESPTSATVLKMLIPFGYLGSFTNPGGYNYYVGTGPSGGCAENTTGTVVACMLKSSADSADCFKGARYYQGGRIQTIRGADCKNSDNSN